MAYKQSDPESYLGIYHVKGHLRASKHGVPHPVRRYRRRGQWGMAVRYNPEVLYHLAREEDVESILQKGLLPSDLKKVRPNFDSYPGMRERIRGRVFMVPHMKNIEQVAGYMPRSRSAILRVNTHGLPLFEGQNDNSTSSSLSYRGTENPYYVEYFTTRKIRPERIQVVGSHDAYSRG